MTRASAAAIAPSPDTDGGAGTHALLFAAGRDDPRSRRPVDALRAIAYLCLVLLAATLSVIGTELDERLSSALVEFPGFLHAFLLVAIWGVVIWAGALLVTILVRRRPLLVAEALLAAALAVAGAMCVAAVLGRSVGDVYSRFGDVDGPPLFPPALLAASWAALATLAPRLTLPFRRVGRGLLLAQLAAALLLASALPSGAAVAVFVGLLAGTTLHLVFGSPGGFPTTSRIRQALADLGVEVLDIDVVAMNPDGSIVLVGSDRAGPLHVKVFGRDAWDGELLANVWRRTWYRGAQRTLRASRLEYVEHEAFVTLLAQQAGARVQEVITAGAGVDGDALIATRYAGTSLADRGAALDADELASLWDQLERLHRSGIVHQRIDIDRIERRTDGRAGFGDLSSASVKARPEDKLQDHAQLLALGLVTAGESATVQQARSALGDDALARALPYLQNAALPPLVRAAIRSGHVALDDVRDRLADELGTPEVELVKLRRVTWRSLVNLALLIVAAYTLIAMLAGIDLASFWRALRDADWWWLGAALLIGQTPRIANAVSTMGSSTQPLPLGPTAMMQFAKCYVNLAVPSSAGSVALTTRYFQRFGVAPAAALSAGVLDSVSDLVVQGGLFLLAFLVSDVDLGLSLQQSQLAGLATTALIVLAVVVVAAAVCLLVPALRTRARTAMAEARAALAVLRSPTRLLQLFGGSLLSQILFAITLGACVRAFGFHVPLTELILINTVVSLFAGILPIPGGVGVTEGGLSLGLTRVGIPAELALAIALSYRFVVFYLPPLWGYLSLKWMTARHYL